MTAFEEGLLKRLGCLVASAMLVAILSMAPASRASVVVHDVPATIDRTGRSDVTAALAAFVAGVPDGATIAFPAGARYRIEGTLLFEGRHNLTFEGNGAEFFATTLGDRNRAHWKFGMSSGITVRNVVITGPNAQAGASGPYNPELEAQAGFTINSSTDVLLERVTVTRVYGDFVYMASQAQLTRNVTVRDSTFEGSGRQGIAVSGAEDVVIERNWVSGVPRSIFDLEPFSVDQVTRRIHIRDNDIGPGRFSFVAALGVPSVMEDIEIVGNRLHGKIPSISFRGHDIARRARITVADNVSDTGANHAVFHFAYVDGITVTGNSVPLRILKGDEVAIDVFQSCFITVEGNDFGNAPPIAAEAVAAAQCQAPGPPPGAGPPPDNSADPGASDSGEEIAAPDATGSEPADPAPTGAPDPAAPVPSDALGPLPGDLSVPSTPAGRGPGREVAARSVPAVTAAAAAAIVLFLHGVLLYRRSRTGPPKPARSSLRPSD